MPYKRIAKIVFVVCVAIVCTISFAGVLTTQFDEPNMAPGDEKIRVQNCTAIKTPGNINISFAVNSQSSISIPIIGFQINGFSAESLPGMACYLNGTKLEEDYSPLLVIKKSDTLLVNLVLPTTFSDPRTDSLYVKVNVLTPGVTYYAEASYP